MSDNQEFSFSMDDIFPAKQKTLKRPKANIKSAYKDISLDQISNPYSQFDILENNLPKQTTEDNVNNIITANPTLSKTDLFKTKKQRYDKFDMQRLLPIIGTNGGKKIKFTPALTTKNGAEYWVNQYHPDWNVIVEDLDGDDIDDVVIKDTDNDIYSINGYHTGKNNLSLIQPYYDAFPSREDRRAARQKGITPRTYAIKSLTKGQKPFDINKPYKIEYVDEKYKETPRYKKMKEAKTLPIIPTKRSAYQVFTTLIIKPVWNAFKQYLRQSETYKNFITVKVIDGQATYGIKDALKYNLPSPSMLWFSAYAYEKYVKLYLLQHIVGDKNNPAIAEALKEKVEVVAKSLKNRKKLNMPYNKTKFALYSTAIDNKNNKSISDDKNFELQKAVMLEFYASQGFKNESKSRVSEFINETNRPKIIQALFNELITALTNEDKLLSLEQRQKMNNDEEEEDNDEVNENEIELNESNINHE